MSAKRDKKNEENKLRAYFVRLFGRYDFRNEEHFRHFGRGLFFILLMLVEVLVALQQIDRFLDGGKFLYLLGSLIVIGVLSIAMAIQLFVVGEKRARKVFYVIDALSSGAFLFFSGGVYALLVYILVLTQFYIETEKTKSSFLLLTVGILFYMLFVGLNRYFRYQEIVYDFFELFDLSFGSVLALVTHFFAVQIALAFYRQYLKLSRTHAELDESKKELEKAYAVVAEVTALEERQRIAKDIHDTAGHSLTTVIMQTESAKRIIDENPQEAKQKIIAANLQAKHALEELRTSVHLLSGSSEGVTLRDSLLGIIHESTDGTGITIRSEIAELTPSPAKHRFLCNSLKEGISNGLRHGGATAFWFELKAENGKIYFLLSDNGKGVEGKTEIGFGLRTMQERATALGGEIAVYTEPDEGFELRITLPLDLE